MIQTLTVGLGPSGRGFYPFSGGGQFLLSSGLVDATVWVYVVNSGQFYYCFSRRLVLDSDAGNRNCISYQSLLPVTLLLQSKYALNGQISRIY